MDGAVEVLGAAARAAAAGAGTRARTGAAAGAGAVSATPTEASSAKPTAPAAAAEAAAAVRRGRRGTALHADAAGLRAAVRPRWEPQVVDEHIPRRAEAAPVPVGSARDGIDDAEHHNHHDHQRNHGHDPTVAGVLRLVIIRAAALVERRGPVVIADGDVQPLAVGEILALKDVGAWSRCAGDGAGGDAVRICPGERHLPDARLVEPAGRVVIGDGAAIEVIHVLLRPGVGEEDRFAVVIATDEVDVHVAVVIAQTVDVGREGGFIPDRAVRQAPRRAPATRSAPGCPDCRRRYWE